MIPGLQSPGPAQRPRCPARDASGGQSPGSDTSCRPPWVPEDSDVIRTLTLHTHRNKCVPTHVLLIIN